MRTEWGAALALLMAACGGPPAPKPLPSGQPPEYEEPRAFEGGKIGDTNPGTAPESFPDAPSSIAPPVAAPPAAPTPPKAP